MPYNFRNTSKVYLVYASGASKLQLDVYRDLEFSQTFEEGTVPKKTLHTQTNLFAGATIVRANAANFSFTLPFLTVNDFNVFLNLGRDYSNNSLASFDLYIENLSEVIKIENCVIGLMDFNLQRDALLTVRIEGTGSKLSRFGATGVTIPGSPISRGVREFVIPKRFNCVLGGSTMSFVSAISLTLKNEINWVPNTTVNAAMAVTSAANTIYPAQYVLASRDLTGAIEQYVTETTTSYQTWSLNSSLTIAVSMERNPNILSAVMPSVAYTNRLQASDAYKQVYDFKMLTNPTALSSVLTFN
jgi:hypothetical protein